MTKRMLIDAAHAEETRVVVVDGSRIEELDFESKSRKQLRGNIYLAKVTRVEPSLQAAFIEYGGNRHGFLAFNEIHPDYYQIPMADREALLREEAEEEAQIGPSDMADSDDEDEMDEVVERRRRRLMRRYKIQEVVKRRQIMLVQVVKEERGNKGAALTTYLSLAGRYCVLMPNTARGGGISRKITSATDRRRLKSAVQSLDVPLGMGLIIRTAGAARTKLEIKRDYEYLMRLWENIREKTLQSIAPALIYEEEDLVKRAIRDMFDKDLDSIQVEGDAGYREARDFMRMIMPSQASKVMHYREPTPLFVRHKVEDQISQIHSPVVQLKSGGYLVINQTEALVAIDVNSGRSTRERNIETTALKTNVEAAEEAARQLRLRDLAGLIVIDFIDMDEAKNNRTVEKVLKDALKDDRARLQMGKISSFGLMEISRQRRRTGVLEGSTHVCDHCQGTGRVRSVESSAVAALRAIEMESVKGGAGAIIVRLPTPVGLYLLNEKRVYLADLDETQDLHVTIVIDDKLAQAEVEIERTETREGPPRERPAEIVEPEADWTPPDDQEDDEEEAEQNEVEVEARGEEAQEDGGHRRRRRRGARRDEALVEPAREESLDLEDEDEAEDADADGDSEGDGEGDGEGGDEARFAGDEDGGHRRRRRRRGRRGGRRLREETRPADVYAWTSPHGDADAAETSGDPYVWLDPHTASAPSAAPAPIAPPGGAYGERPAGRPPGAAGGPGFERKRGRGRRRGRGGGEGYAPRSAFEGQPENDPYVWRDAEAPTTFNDDASETVERGYGDGGETAETDTSYALPLEPVIEGPLAAATVEPTSPEAVGVLEASPPLEPEAPTGRRPRRSRAKAAKTDERAVDAPIIDGPEAAASDATTPEAPTTPEPAFAPAPAPAEPEAALIEPAAEPEPAVAAVPAAVEPPPPPTPDPAEISTPPATPRRGWWRRLV